MLIADDNRDGAESTQLYLQMQGHEVHVALNGTEALSVAAQIQPEVGVIDIGLPDMSGYEVARHIREEAGGRGCLLIALTGWGQESDKLRARAAGFDRHCTKPVDPGELEWLFSSSWHGVRFCVSVLLRGRRDFADYGAAEDLVCSRHDPKASERSIPAVFAQDRSKHQAP